MQTRQPDKPIAVVVVSGGLDSCVVATLAARSYRPAMLHVQYGQRTAEREHAAFQAIAHAIGAFRSLVIHMDHFSLIGGSSLTDPDIPVPDVSSDAIPSTYVPFRNANLFAAAVSWAEVIGAVAVFTGINQVDGSGYPDCTEDFLSAFNRVIAAGTRPETHVRILAPFLNLTKKDIVRTGLDLGAPLHLSWSCYRNTEKACGTCDSCRLRLKGFEANNAIDPILYEGFEKKGV